MDLILWRHAEAEEGAPDSGRKLTDKGQKQAQAIAKWLKSRLPEDVTIIVSPTKRTQQTAAALTDNFDTVEEVGPGVPPQAILEAGWGVGKGAMLIVGHQPTLGQAAALIMTGRPSPWTVRKGAIWWFSRKDKQRNSGASGEVILRAVISPDMA